MIASQPQPWSRLGLRFVNEKLLALWNDKALRVSVSVFIVLRVITLLVALAMVGDVPAERPPLLWFNSATGIGNPSGITYESSLPPNAPFANLMMPWRRYDTAWYVLIAAEGYRDDTRIVFPPLYPILIHAVTPLSGGNAILASVLVSNISCLAAFFLLYKLVEKHFGDGALATRTLILLAAFPTGFYLIAGYTEPVFLALTLGAFLAASDRRWWLAGGCAFLASLTRVQGIILSLPLAWIAYEQYGRIAIQAIRHRTIPFTRSHLRSVELRFLLQPLPAVIGAPLGTLAYIGYIAVNNLGSLERAYGIGWKLSTRMPWESILTYFERIQAGIVPAHENNNAFALVLMAVLAVVVLWRFRRVYALYAGITLFVILMRYHFGPGLEGAQFESAFRYVLFLFPCFIAGALILKRRWAFILCVLIMVQWQLYLLDQFIHWRWVA